MKRFVIDLFNDNNSINEKALVGFIAFSKSQRWSHQN